MSEPALSADLPWSIFHQEDRRFRWILAQTLAVSLLLGVIAPQIPIPAPETSVQSDVPPRRVRLLPERPAPRPQPAPAPVPAPPPVNAAPRPAAIATPAPVKPARTARQAAASSGVLAMGDALDELRALAPSGDVSPGRPDTGIAVDRTQPQSSALAADVTRGSGGIEVGVAHQSVLGSPDLPQREGVRRLAGDADRGGVSGQRTAAVSPGSLRSQEEIQELLDRNKGAMYTLYNRELRVNSGLQGRLVMSITIDPAGRVTRCVITSSELGSDSLERQLVALVTNIDFGDRPGVPAVTTRIPIEFFPR